MQTTEQALTVDFSRPESKHRENFRKFRNACIKVTTFLFSRVGLTIMLIGYVQIGGIIFKSIEGTHEQQEKANNRSIVNDVDTQSDLLAHEIWNMTKSEVVFHEKNYTNKLKTRLIEFRKVLSNAVKQGYSNLDNTKWTYSSSILYSVTIVTTIGYGHITCVTDTGKIATMLYALIGMPMTILCFVNLGSSMAVFFRFVYVKICCSYCNYVKQRNRRRRLKAITQMNALSFAALASKNYEITQAGTATTVAGLENAKKKEEEAIKSHSRPNEAAEIIDLFEENTSVDYKKITVPISITLFILSSYIIAGGILFKMLEGWSMLDGVYFCFVTLSTIGLGDLVPGNSMSINEVDNEAEYKLVGCAIYLLIGLNLISMCFNLMQEEVTAKFRRLAIRLGIIDDPNYW